MTVKDERRGIIMEEMNDSIKDLCLQMTKIADALSKIADCVNEDGQLKISTREYKYK